jgi:hypothetical protein
MVGLLVRCPDIANYSQERELSHPQEASFPFCWVSETLILNHSTTEQVQESFAKKRAGKRGLICVQLRTIQWELLFLGCCP